jgi:hypothetical protein
MYDNGKIYKLQCNDGHFYIGSTTSLLKYRKRGHVLDSAKYPERKIYNHINKIGWENVKIQLVEDYPCDSRKELIEREDYYIKKEKEINNQLCLNFNRSYVPLEEKKENMKKYYEEHKEDIIEKHRVYVKENEEHIKDYRKSYNKINSERRSAYTKEYVKQHPEETKETKKLYYEKNKEEITKKNMEYVEKNKEIVAERKRKWAERNKERLKKEAKEKRAEKKEEIKERGKKYFEENKEEILRKNKEYYEKNKDKINEQIKEYREKNKEKYSKQSVCECGGTYTGTREKRHKESKKHQNWEEKNESASSLTE